MDGVVAGCGERARPGRPPRPPGRAPRRAPSRARTSRPPRTTSGISAPAACRAGPPGAIGSRTAYVTWASNDGQQNVGLSGTGILDQTAPESTFTTPNGAVVSAGSEVFGHSADDSNQITYVVVTFTPVVSVLTPTAVVARPFGCTPTSCY